MWDWNHSILVRVVGERKTRSERLMASLAGDRGLLLVAGWPGEDGRANGMRQPVRVVVLDVATCDPRSLEDIQAIRRQEVEAPLLIVGDRAPADFVMSSVQAGAGGFVVASRQGLATEVSSAIRALARGLGYFCPEAARALVQARLGTVHTRGFSTSASPLFGSTTAALSVSQPPATETTAAGEDGPLTPREREILRLVAEGHSTPTIARLLEISAKTVEGHRGRIMAKLKIHNVAGLVRHAIRTGVITA